MARMLPVLALLLLVLALSDCGEDAEPRLTATPTVTAATSPPPAAPTATPAPPTPTPETVTVEPQASPTDEPEVATASPQPGWVRLEVTGEAPQPRQNAVLALDAAAGRLFLHGGRAAGQPLADLWSFDLGARTWTRLQPAGEVPVARFGHAAVFDAARGRLVFFGGQAGGDFFNDVWAYEPATERWSNLAKEGRSPAPRYGTCAAFDAAGDRFIISHGFTNSGRFDDTWAFSLASGDWADISPQGTRPVKRCLHVCTWDPTGKSLLLFGGQTNGAPQLGDLWALGAGGWGEVSASPAPSPRRLATAVAAGGALVLTGGIGMEGRLSDSWRLGHARRAWQELSLPAAPEPRHSHAAAADEAMNVLYVFGGNAVGGDLNDLWVLRLEG